MTINKATEKDTNEVIELYNSSKNHMIENNIFQWNDEYPKTETIISDIHNSDLYKYSDSSICGVIVLNEFQDEEYKSVQWEFNHERILVIHRLAVHPLHQGKGIAKKLMDFAETYAKKNSYESIRLDAFTENPTASNLYLKRGYKIRGKVYFDYRDIPFNCFEKLIL